MTAKRYRKLMRAYLTEIMAGHDKCGQVLKATRNLVPNFGYIEGVNSYDAMWNMVVTNTVKAETYRTLAPFIR